MLSAVMCAETEPPRPRSCARSTRRRWRSSARSPSRPGEGGRGGRRARARRRALGAVVVRRAPRAAQAVAQETARRGRPAGSDGDGGVRQAARRVVHGRAVRRRSTTCVWAGSNALRACCGPERLRFSQPHLRHKRGLAAHEPLGVIAVISPWNFPLGIPLTQAGLRRSRRERGRAEAVGADAAERRLGSSASSAKPGAPGPRRASCRVAARRQARRYGQGAGRLPRVVFTGSGRSGASVRRSGRRAAAARDARAPAAEDPMRRLRRRRPRPRGRRRALGLVLELRPGLLGRRARSTSSGRCEGVTSRSSCAGRGAARSVAATSSDTELRPLIAEERRAHVESWSRTRSAAARRLRHRRASRPTSVCRVGSTSRPCSAGWTPRRVSSTGGDLRAGRDRQRLSVTGTRQLRLANSSRFGLGARRLDARPRAGAARRRGRLEAGSVWTNDVSYSYGTSQASWGGTKKSGFGRTHGKHGLLRAPHGVKFADLDRGRVPVPWWYPYDQDVQDGFRRRGVRAALRRGPPRKLGKAWQHRRGLVQTRTAVHRVVSELSHVDEAGEVGWWTSAASRSRAGVRWRGRPCASRRTTSASSPSLPKGDALVDGAARRDHGGEADERADPALPPARR